MKIFVFLLLLSSNCIIGQAGNIAQFAVWKPKAGQAQNFENGYRQHLLWHKENKDLWDWYGWHIISGERYGQFIDATFNHPWQDFDQAIKPAEDRADNNLHVFPFGDVQTVFKAAYLPELSAGDDDKSLKSRLLRMVTLNLSGMDDGKKVIRKYKESVRQSADSVSLLVFKMIDGGNPNQLILFIGAGNFNEFGRTENLLEELSAIEKNLNIKAIVSAVSETLIYREDMSLFAK